MAPAAIRARYEGDEVKCGSCGRVIAVAVVPTRSGARVPCKSCGEWVTLELPEQPARPTARYPVGGG